MDVVNIGAVSRNYFNLPLWITAQCGFLERYGIVASIHLIQSIDEVSNRIGSGDLDWGLSVTENVILDREHGGDQVIVAGNVNRLPFSLIAAPGVKTIQELRGKTIGVSSLLAGSSSLVVRLLAEAGLTYPGDYSLVDCGPILSRWEKLKSGEIQAGLQGVPLNYIAVDAGFTDLGTPRDRFPDYQFTSLNVSARVAAAKRDILTRFIRAYLDAHAWFHTHREESVAVTVRETGVGEDYAGRAWDEYTAQTIFPRDGRASIAGITTLLGVSGLIRALPKRSVSRAEDYVDHGYLEAALHL